MKYLTKLILITSQLAICAFAAEKPDAPQTDKPVLKIAAFTMKSSDGTLEMKMDDQGKITLGGKHIATAHANGQISKPEGETIVRIKEDGDVDPALFGAPVKVTPNGTLTGGDETHSWVDGKFDLGQKGHLEITPKDSPSKPVATLMFLTFSSRQPGPEPKQ